MRFRRLFYFQPAACCLCRVRTPACVDQLQAVEAAVATVRELVSVCTLAARVRAPLRRTVTRFQATVLCTSM